MDDSSVYRQILDQVYGDVYGVGLLMDIFLPRTAANGRAIVNVVSGGFHSERVNVNDLINMGMYRALCGRGFTVFAIRPGSIEVWGVPRMRDHVRLGIRWVKAHAAEYGFEPDRLGITGVSAGGFLTSLAALVPLAGSPDADNPLEHRDTRVAAVAVVCAPADLVGWQKSREGTMHLAEILGQGTPDGFPAETLGARAREYSPVFLAHAEAPPFFLMHATGDPIVQIEESEKLAAALKSARVDTTLIHVDSDEHVWPTIADDMARMAQWFVTKLT